MDKIINSDPMPGSVILVTGAAGTLKSTFVLSAMNSYLDQHPQDTALYTTMEERRESLLSSMQSIGVKQNKRLFVRDIGSFMIDTMVKQMASSFKARDYVELAVRGLTREHSENNGKIPCCYALDSLNALWTTAGINGDAARQKSLELFHKLRSSKAYCFIIAESTPVSNSPDFHLADGIIELGTIKAKSCVKRYIQVKKMKAVRHSLEPFVIDVMEKGGLIIIGPLR